MGNRERMTDDQTRKVAELIKGERFGFLTTITHGRPLTSRPMTLQEVEFDGDLWFFAERDSNPVQHITASPQVNVGVGSGGTWVSLTGDARRRRGRGEEAGAVEQRRRGVVPPGPGRRQRRPAQGARPTPRSTGTAPGGRLATVFSFAKAKVTGERIEGGENEKVDL